MRFGEKYIYERDLPASFVEKGGKHTHIRYGHTMFALLLSNYIVQVGQIFASHIRYETGTLEEVIHIQSCKITMKTLAGI